MAATRAFIWGAPPLPFSGENLFSPASLVPYLTGPLTQAPGCSEAPRGLPGIRVAAYSPLHPTSNPALGGNTPRPHLLRELLSCRSSFEKKKKSFMAIRGVLLLKGAMIFTNSPPNSPLRVIGLSGLKWVGEWRWDFVFLLFSFFLCLF